MLVLSRRLNEGIRIGKDVRIVVVDTRDGKVRLGIEAPRNVIVDRDEIFERKLAGEPPMPLPECA